MSENPYAEEKAEGRNCCNHSCQFWDEFYEQHCSAAHSDGEPYIDDCERYIPERGDE